MQTTHLRYYKALLRDIKKKIRKKNLFFFIFSDFRKSFIQCKKVIIEKGLNYFLQSGILVILNPHMYLIWLNDEYTFWTWFYTNYKTKRTFKFNGKKYRYFYHRNWITWNNERSVEVPIVLEIVKKYKGKDFLEVGNVLMNFYNYDRTIVDKYEVASGVINEDIVDYNPNKKYDVIITISTLEHVGWNEEPREPQKVLKALDNLKRLLKKNGMIIITIPIGWNSYLDNLIKEDKIPFTKNFFLKRVSKNNRWKEVTMEKIRNVIYPYPIRSAYGILIGIIK